MEELISEEGKTILEIMRRELQDTDNQVALNHMEVKADIAGIKEDIVHLSAGVDEIKELLLKQLKINPDTKKVNSKIEDEVKAGRRESIGHDDVEKKVPTSLNEEMNNENIDDVLDYDSSEDKEVDLSNYRVNNRRNSGQFSAFINQTPGPPIKNRTIYYEYEDDFKIEDIPEFKGINLNNEKEFDTKKMQGMFPLIMKMINRNKFNIVVVVLLVLYFLS
jgi:hypothetical protein